ncbi:hypothetical protein CHS0354_001575 [Potamilus streckersoni]|uniref:PAS domain-containing protein n=1 Tax=Potamilus streckersoni TaxID=2493646 RepID=A0AAE0VX88_9BIVA|nr:hypothetical protein CHS0354_001575 [Potamilus streckersoni]
MAYIPRQLVSDTSSVLNDQSSSSSSSFSMSFSGSDDFVEDMPSTSGCSSDMAHSKKLGHKEKKEKMKRYLRELRTIIKPYRHKGGKIGTLSALEHVLSSLREQNEKKTKNPGEPVEGCEEGRNIRSFPKCVSLDTEQLVVKNELTIVLNVKGLTVSYVSQNIKETLGHSKDSWLGRLLTDFVHKSDLFTFQSCIHIEEFDSFLEDSDSDSKTPKEITERTVFFRLKCFKSLVSGFSLNKEDVYKPFKVLVRYKYLYPSTIENYTEKNCISLPSGTSGEKTGLSPPSLTDFDSSSGTYEVKKKYIVLDCMTLTSGYKELGQLPMERTFSTRHTSSCCYSYILPSVTELMGYLPQEMIGSSVFDFYHPDDLNELYKTYKTIIQINGTPFRGKPIRFRTKNGDWIVTETEWSSFINPWSKKLEFIIGWHTVIKGPENLNIFQESPHPCEPLSEQTLKLHQKIKDLLQQPLDTVDLSGSKKTVKMSTLRNDKHVAFLDEPMETTEDDSSFTKDGMGNKYEASHCHLPEHVSPKVFDDTSTSMAYDQLNYTSNIKKFLLSQPRSFSPKSDLNKGSSEGYDEEEYQNVVDPEFEVDISVPKPPSFGSSTKVLVSEQEHHEDPLVSPRHVDESTLEEGLPKDLKQPSTSSNLLDYPVKVTLTREVLWKHTKLQEELYVAEAKQDRSLFGLRTDRSDIFSNRVQRKKRIHSLDDSSFMRNQIVEKIPRLCKEETFGNVLHPPFPLAGNPSGNSTKENIIPTHPAVIGMTVPVYPFVKVQPNMNINVSAPVSLSYTSTSTSNNNGNVEWPYYPVSGGTLNPQVMVGFYQSRFDFVPAYPNISKLQDLLTQGKIQNSEEGRQTMTVITSAPTPNAYSAELEEMKILSGQFPPVISSSELSSLEDTGSSFMYLLETDSAQFSEINTQAFDKIKMEPQYQLPFWLEGIHYTKDIELHYRLPVKKRSRVLKEDRESVHLQPDLVVQQLKAILEDLEQENQLVIDEEADYLIFLDDGEEFVDDTKADYVYYDSSNGSHWSEFWNSSFCGTTQSANPQSLSQTETPLPLHLENEENKDLQYQSSELYKVHDQEKGVKYEGRHMDGTTSQQMLNKQEEIVESIELNLLPADENTTPSQAESVLEVNNDTIQEYFMLEEGNFKCVKTGIESSKGHNMDSSNGQMKSSEHDIDLYDKHMESIEQTVDPSSDKSESAEPNIDPSEGHMGSSEANVDSLEDMESNYSKQSSDLTLSDQRSNEEAASSFKESDSSYKKRTYKSKKHIRFQRNMKEVDNLFEKLFVSLPIIFPHLKKRLPPWLAEVNMTHLIKMEFTLRKRDLNEILAQDKVMLNKVIQPALVSEQFQVLMHELDGQAKGVEDLLDDSKPTIDMCWEDTGDMTKE